MFARLSMELDHRFTVRHASAYLDGDLSPRATKRVRDHASVCPMCAEMFRTLRATLAGLRGLRDRPTAPTQQPGDASDSVVPSILEALREEAARDRRGVPPDDG